MSKTKVGTFIAKVGKVFPEVANAGAKLLDGTPIGGVLDIVSNVLKEKKEIDENAAKLLTELEEKRVEFEQEFIRLQVQDTADARALNKSIQESENASWLAKNTSYILDFFVAVIWGILTIIICLRAMNITVVAGINSDMIYGIYTAVTGVFMVIVGYHRGSSAGSKMKDDQLNKIYGRNGK